MTVKQLSEHHAFEIITMPQPEREIKNVYIGDLLSWVMGHAGAGNIWITIMSNINIVAVASLTGVSAIVVAEGAAISQDIIDKATEQGINILRTNDSTFFSAIKIAKVLGIDPCL